MPPLNINALPWSTVASVARPEEGTAALFVTFNDTAGRVVVKGTMDVVAETFATLLLRAVGLASPQTRVVAFTEREWSTMKQALTRACAGDEALKRYVARLVDRPVLYVQRFVEGAVPLYDAKVNWEDPSFLRSLGEVLAADVVLNNSDRIACGDVWGNEGNLGNILVCDASLRVTPTHVVRRQQAVPIDSTCIARMRPEAYMAKVAGVVNDVEKYARAALEGIQAWGVPVVASGPGPSSSPGGSPPPPAAEQVFHVATGLAGCFERLTRAFANGGLADTLATYIRRRVPPTEDWEGTWQKACATAFDNGYYTAVKATLNGLRPRGARDTAPLSPVERDAGVFAELVAEQWGVADFHSSTPLRVTLAQGGYATPEHAKTAVTEFFKAFKRPLHVLTFSENAFGRAKAAEITALLDLACRWNVYICVGSSAQPNGENTSFVLCPDGMVTEPYNKRAHNTHVRGDRAVHFNMIVGGSGVRPQDTNDVGRDARSGRFNAAGEGEPAEAEADEPMSPLSPLMIRGDSAGPPTAAGRVAGTRCSTCICLDVEEADILADAMAGGTRLLLNPSFIPGERQTPAAWRAAMFFVANKFSHHFANARAFLLKCDTSMACGTSQVLTPYATIQPLRSARDRNVHAELLDANMPEKYRDARLRLGGRVTHVRSMPHDDVGNRVAIRSLPESWWRAGASVGGLGATVAPVHLHGLAVLSWKGGGGALTLACGRRLVDIKTTQVELGATATTTTTTPAHSDPQNPNPEVSGGGGGGSTPSPPPATLAAGHTIVVVLPTSAEWLTHGIAVFSSTRGTFLARIKLANPNPDLAASGDARADTHTPIPCGARPTACAVDVGDAGVWVAWTATGGGDGGQRGIAYIPLPAVETMDADGAVDATLDEADVPSVGLGTGREDSKDEDGSGDGDVVCAAAGGPGVVWAGTAAGGIVRVARGSSSGVASLVTTGVRPSTPTMPVRDVAPAGERVVYAIHEGPVGLLRRVALGESDGVNCGVHETFASVGINGIAAIDEQYALVLDGAHRLHVYATAAAAAGRALSGPRVVHTIHSFPFGGVVPSRVGGGGVQMVSSCTPHAPPNSKRFPLVYILAGSASCVLEFSQGKEQDTLAAILVGDGNER